MFKKGHIPWNTGKKLSKKIKQKISLNAENNPNFGMKGKHHSEKTKKRISKTRINKKLSKGKNNSMYGKRGKDSPLYGSHRSRETKIKMSNARKGIIYSDKTKEKMSKSKMGEKHPMFGIHRFNKKAPNWQGGLTPINTIIRGSEKYTNWRKAIFERDDYTCQNPECQRRGGCLHAHHIFPFSKYPELRFDINNGLTFCKDCHMEV